MSAEVDEAELARVAKLLHEREKAGMHLVLGGISLVLAAVMAGIGWPLGFYVIAGGARLFGGE